MLGPEIDNNMLLDESVLEKIEMLGQVGLPEGFPGGKLPGIAGFQPNLLFAMQLHFAII
ncbi:hypothetical protein SDC9_167471 [bioreactor metagenome]|uniref:Uncharacterized protein n=1 Tax=bioreactor metagenome TaxID=1076179 RepID=A0A645G7K9_9ZZZZ